MYDTHISLEHKSKKQQRKNAGPPGNGANQDKQPKPLKYQHIQTQQDPAPNTKKGKPERNQNPKQEATSRQTQQVVVVREAWRY